MDPTISMVVVSFNRGEVACRAVRSILDQEGVDLEVVVVDASNDGTTCELIAAIGDPRLTVVTAWNAGMNTNRNVGIELARGRWIGFLDDDDILLPGWG